MNTLLLVVFLFVSSQVGELPQIVSDLTRGKITWQSVEEKCGLFEGQETGANWADHETSGASNIYTICSNKKRGPSPSILFTACLSNKTLRFQVSANLISKAIDLQEESWGHFNSIKKLQV